MPIDVATFDAGNVQLYFEDEPQNLLAGDDRVRIEELGDGQYRLAGINWPQAREGIYRLEVDGAGIRDGAGNPAEGSSRTSWSLHLTPPLPPDELGWMDAQGELLSTDRSTQARDVRVFATLAEQGLRVVLLDAATRERLATIPDAATQIEIPLTLPLEGPVNLLLQLFDPAGNATEVTIPELTVDRKPLVLLTEQPTQTAARATPPETFPLAFAQPVQIVSPPEAFLELHRDGTAVELPPDIELVAADGQPDAYEIRGFETAMDADGHYVLTARGEQIVDASGRTATADSRWEWQLDSTPPALTIAGPGLQDTNPGQGQFTLQISEATNLPDLLAHRKLEQVVVLAAMGADAREANEARLPVPYEAIQLTVDPVDGTTRLNLDFAALTDGVYQWTVVGEAIRDAAGNALDADGNGQPGDSLQLRFHRLFGDVTATGIVDRADLQRVEAALGSHPGDSHWNPAADLNEDGQVTAEDENLVWLRRGHRVLYPEDEPALLQNPTYIYDVNQNGMLAPLDVLAVVNWLNQQGSSSVHEAATAGAEKYLNVNGDDFLSPMDVLMLINQLNALSARQIVPAPPVGEGEATLAAELHPPEQPEQRARSGNPWSIDSGLLDPLAEHQATRTLGLPETRLPTGAAVGSRHDEQSLPLLGTGTDVPHHESIGEVPLDHLLQHLREGESAGLELLDRLFADWDQLDAYDDLL